MSSTPAGQSGDGDTMAEAKVVLVPMKLDAFVLNQAMCQGPSKIAAIQRPDYNALRAESEFLEPDVLPPVDVTNAHDENPRLHDPATGAFLPSRPGVYLHWVMPQCFRHGVTATEDAMDEHEYHKLKSGYYGKDSKSQIDQTPESQSLKLSFRACPNRYLVVRCMTITKTQGQSLSMDKDVVDAFMVTSDTIRYVGTIPYQEDLDVESSPFLDPEAPLERQAEVLLGMKQWADDWEEDEYALRHSPLTIVDCANPYFADYQPQNAGVFSIHDDMSYYEGGVLQKTWYRADASYYVIGWHSNQELDPFHLHEATAKDAPKNGERLKDCFMTLSKEKDYEEWLQNNLNSRMLYHGALYNVTLRYC